MLKSIQICGTEEKNQVSTTCTAFKALSDLTAGSLQKLLEISPLFLPGTYDGILGNERNVLESDPSVRRYLQHERLVRLEIKLHFLYPPSCENFHIDRPGGRSEGLP